MWFSAAVVFVPSFLDTVQRPALPHAVCPRGPLSRPLMRPPDRFAHLPLGARRRQSRPIAFCSFRMQRQRRRSSRLEHAAQPIQGAKGRLWLTLGSQGGAQPHAQRAAAVAAAAMAAWRVPSERRVLDQDQVPDQATREATVRQPRRPGPRRTTTTAAQRAGRVAQSRGGAGRQPDGHARGPQVTLFISFCVSFVPRSGGRCPARRRSSPPSALRSDGRSGGGPAGRFIRYYRFLRLYRAVALTRQRETRCVHRSPRASTVARARKRRRC